MVADSLLEQAGFELSESGIEPEPCGIPAIRLMNSRMCGVPMAPIGTGPGAKSTTRSIFAPISLFMPGSGLYGAFGVK